MKKTIRTLSFRAVPVLLTLALILGIFCIAPPQVRAAGVDITNRFEDENFRAAVREILDLQADAPIYDTDVAGITYLNIESKGIKSITGIEYFTALEFLRCGFNQLTEIDVTGLSSLISLDCYSNNLTTLTAIGLENLQSINCSYNQLVGLNLSDLPNFKILGCVHNQIKKLDLTEFTNLTELSSNHNQLTELRISGLTNLTLVDCWSNQLSELDLTNLPSLRNLYCLENKLTELDINGLTSLEYLHCSDNLLTKLDLSYLSRLQNLSCSYNRLAELNLVGLENLQTLYCNDNQLTSLDVTALTNLQALFCNNSQLEELNISGLDNLQFLFCQNNRLTMLDLYGLTALVQLNCENNHLTTLNVSGLSSLSLLECQYNYIDSEADISGDISNIYEFHFLPQHAPGFYGVTNISGMPTSAVAYTPLPLTATVFPSNATNTTIEWLVDYYDPTGSTVIDNTLYATNSGTVQLRAIIRDGFAADADYEQYFFINITMPDNVLPFFDVPENMWYREYVKTAYDDGLVNGKAPGFYHPEDNMTVAEAVKIAACMHQLYNDGEVTLTNAPAPAPWYASYMDYALQNNIIDADLSDVADTMITRKEFVYMLYSALPESEYATINNVADDAIPDVKISSDSKYAPRIYEFYRAGILTGSDEIGTFYPESNIKRNEVAAVLTRMLHESARRPITLG